MDEYFRRIKDKVAALPPFGPAFKKYTERTGVLYRTDLNKTASTEKGEKYFEILTTHLAKRIQNQWLW